MTKEKSWKKKNVPLLNFSKTKEGGQDTIEGVFLKIKSAGENTDEETGEVKERFTAMFRKIDSDEKFQVWLNAGLKGALEMNDVQEGNTVRIVHLGLVPRSKGVGSVNQYDVFTLE